MQSEQNINQSQQNNKSTKFDRT